MQQTYLTHKVFQNISGDILAGTFSIRCRSASYDILTDEYLSLYHVAGIEILIPGRAKPIRLIVRHQSYTGRSIRNLLKIKNNQYLLQSQNGIRSCQV